MKEISKFRVSTATARCEDEWVKAECGTPCWRQGFLYLVITKENKFITLLRIKTLLYLNHGNCNNWNKEFIELIVLEVPAQHWLSPLPWLVHVQIGILSHELGRRERPKDCATWAGPPTVSARTHWGLKL